MLLKKSLYLTLALTAAACGSDSSSDDEPAPAPKTETPAPQTPKPGTDGNNGGDDNGAALVDQAVTSAQGLWGQACVPAPDNNGHVIYWISWEGPNFSETKEIFQDEKCEESTSKVVRVYKDTEISSYNDKGYFRAAGMKESETIFDFDNPKGKSQEVDTTKGAWIVYFKVDGDKFLKGQVDKATKEMKDKEPYTYSKVDGTIPERTYVEKETPESPKEPEGAILFADFEGGDLGGFTSLVTKGVKDWSNYKKDGASSASINGYNTNVENETWLYSKKLDLSKYTNEAVILSFDHERRFGPDTINDEIGVFVSDKFDPAKPNANWVELKGFNIPEKFAGFANSGEIDLSTYKGKSITIGFRYRSSIDKPVLWAVDNVTVTAK
ncbi:choice-of-anchor J domain-containing protein [Pseudobacteriovorax antillogorgiicola]|uniref:Lipoprotein n=1 Tax=Pseudobacteriovorax antillogorgiicola TaxID=1513793 RepID=A0A1Y6CFR1_9BACT|nr:choice-of-anchor J domain-containing protein [Pseudobacteriovorax antillogorgiicola]TCS48018.1 hypothetical protein EDD56_119129 [Pseudobacteriovorax antillogorgiicola]SMF58692.1 hypothetical protein SAMN06296036_119130 [Pseudobacteriovorax antillogorgiicola]